MTFRDLVENPTEISGQRCGKCSFFRQSWWVDAYDEQYRWRCIPCFMEDLEGLKRHNNRQRWLYFKHQDVFTLILPEVSWHDWITENAWYRQ